MIMKMIPSDSKSPMVELEMSEQDRAGTPPGTSLINPAHWSEIVTDTPSSCSVIIAYQGDEIVAFNPWINTKSKRVMKGVAGKDDSLVIQAAADIGPGIIQLRRNFSEPYSADYILTTKVNLSHGTLINCGNSRIDLTGLDDTAFSWDNPLTSHTKTRSGILDGMFVGNRKNLNTLIAYFHDVPNDLIVSKIKSNGVSNGFHAYGACFFAKFENNLIVHGNGAAIKLQSSTTVGEEEYYPNAWLVDHCDIEDMAVGLSSLGVSTQGTARKSWFEACGVGIYNECTNINIINNEFSVNANQVGIQQRGENGHIKDNTIDLKSSSLGILIDPAINRIVVIRGNRFVSGANATLTSCIESDPTIWLRGSISDNSAGTQVSTFYTGKTQCKFNDNVLSGDGSNAAYIFADQSGWMQINRNDIFGFSEAIAGYMHDSDVMHGSIGGSIALLGPRNKIKFNRVYITENSGSSIGTGEEQIIPHGLSFTPIRQQVILFAGSATANPYHSKAPDVTNIYVTAGNGQPWYWNVP